LASLLLCQNEASAAQVTLAWDASDKAAGYKIYYGTSSNQYTSVIDVGSDLTYIFTDLPDGRTYFFAATAYDDSRLESDYSTEVSYSATLDHLLYTSFTGHGLYKYDGITGARLDSLVPTTMAASGSTLYAGYTGYGLYKYDGNTWTHLDSLVPKSMASGQ
jgi:hypothetical protein